MPRMHRARLATVVPLFLPLAIALAAAPAGAGDWSRFRGPNGSGVIEATGLPVKFGPGSNVAWQTKVPFGRSSPAVGESQIFLTGIEGDTLVVLALDRKDGSEVWRRQVERGHTAELHKATDSSTPSPVTDGSNVYVFFHEAGLVSYDSAGKQRWHRSLGPFRNFYSIAASPILAGDLVVMLIDQAENSFLVALDKNSGEEVWRRNRPGRREAYSTPVLLSDGSVLVSGSRWVDAYDPATGANRWTLGGVGTSPVSSPTVAGDILFVNAPDHAPEPPAPFGELTKEHDDDGDGELSRAELEGSWMQNHFLWLNTDGKDGITAEDWDRFSREVVNDNWGLYAIRLPGDGGKAEILWNYRKNVPYISSPISRDGIFYMVKDGIVTSLEPTTGELIKRGRLTDGSPKVYASPIFADSKLFIATVDGQVAVLTPGRQWEVLATNDLGEEIYATPAVADDRLLVRTRGHLYAFAEPPAETAPVTTGQ